MLNDETQYPDPRNFYPERFMGSTKETTAQNGETGPNTVDPKDVIFGFGRRYEISLSRIIHALTVVILRICPGRFFADASVWLTIANVLAVFEIGPYVEPSTGAEVRPEVAYLSGFTRSV